MGTVWRQGRQRRRRGGGAGGRRGRRAGGRRQGVRRRRCHWRGSWRGVGGWAAWVACEPVAFAVEGAAEPGDGQELGEGVWVFNLVDDELSSLGQGKRSDEGVAPPAERHAAHAVVLPPEESRPSSLSNWCLSWWRCPDSGPEGWGLDTLDWDAGLGLTDLLHMTHTDGGSTSPALVPVSPDACAAAPTAPHASQPAQAPFRQDNSGVHAQ